MSSYRRIQRQSLGKAKIAWRYALLFTVLLVSGLTSHYINQFRQGHPLDIHYFWTELSPQGIFGLGLYNGPGGTDWKIGEPQATLWNAFGLRSLPESRAFALQLVNRDRMLNGLLPLVEDPLLSQAAQRHAQDMLERQYFDHVSPEGTNVRDRFVAVGGSPRVRIGENLLQSDEQALALTYGKIEEFQRGWMYSNGHRANILTPEYTKFGYGIVMGTGAKTYAVQMLAGSDPAN